LSHHTGELEAVRSVNSVKRAVLEKLYVVHRQRCVKVKPHALNEQARPCQDRENDLRAQLRPS